MLGRFFEQKADRVVLDQLELSLVCSSSLTPRDVTHSKFGEVWRLPVPLEDVLDYLSKASELVQIRVRHCVNSCDELLDLRAYIIQLLHWDQTFWGHLTTAAVMLFDRLTLYYLQVDHRFEAKSFSRNDFCQRVKLFQSVLATWETSMPNRAVLTTEHYLEYL